MSVVFVFPFATAAEETHFHTEAAMASHFPERVAVESLHCAEVWAGAVVEAVSVHNMPHPEPCVINTSGTER